MLRALTIFTLVGILVSDQALAAEQGLITVNWTQFQREVGNRKLLNRTARIGLTQGGEFKTMVRKIEDDGIIVSKTQPTQPWASGPESAKIPRDLVVSVRFDGRTGKGGLIGGLAGLGAGGAIAGGAASMGGSCEGSACGAVLLAIPVCAVAGYLIGRATSKPAPAFRIQR